MQLDVFRPCMFACVLAITAAACGDDGTPESETEMGGSSGSPGTTTSQTSTSGTTEVATTDVVGSSSGSAGSSGGSSDSGETTAAGDSSSSGSGGGTAFVEGDVIVEVAYAGEGEGTLVTALFETCPPAGPPSSFSQIQPGDVAFPQQVELLATGLVAGDSPCVIAYLDLAPASPTAPGPEDPSGQVVFDIVADGASEVAVSLEGGE